MKLKCAWASDPRIQGIPEILPNRTLTYCEWTDLLEYTVTTFLLSFLNTQNDLSEVAFISLTYDINADNTTVQKSKI